MDNSKEQQEGRKRMRELFERREAERGSASLRRKPVFKTPEQEAQDKKKQQIVWTENAKARMAREPTATRGQPPVFNENIWTEEPRRQGAHKDRSISPKTRVSEEEERPRGSGNVDAKKGSGTNNGQARGGGKAGGQSGNPTINKKKPF